MTVAVEAEVFGDTGAAILLGEGRGFEIAQGRLGPGRVHHCMRAIGQAEVAIEKMCRRLNTRVAFGKPLSEQSVMLERVAEARIAIDQAQRRRNSVSANACNEALCRQPRPTEGHRASPRLQDVDLDLPKVPERTRAQESRR
jgi:alkylation response protein AidB-like acyl-CoA dehydrogenase